MKQSMMASLLVLAMAQTIVSCVSCGYTKTSMFEVDGPQVTQVRPIKGFEKIEVIGSPTVYYTQADTFSVRVEGPEDMVDKIVTTVDDGTLTIRNKGKIGMFNISLGDMNKLSVKVSSPDLIGVVVSGSGDFFSSRTVDTDEMQISLRGSGDISFERIICDHCVTELVGSGDISIDRLESQTSDASLIGSGDIQIRQWNVDDTDVSLRGSGDITIDFVEGCRKVSCHLAGSGDVDLKGRVKSMSKHKNGSGDIDTDQLMIER